MTNYNSCTFMGRLAKDVEIKYTPNGKAVANFALAVQRDIADNTGNKTTDFFNFIVWGKPAENMANILQKGDTILVESRAQTRNYEKDGKTVYVHEYVVRDFPKYLKVKKWENGEAGTNQSQSSTSNPYTQPTGNQGDPYSNGGGYEKVSDDDLPF